MTSGPVEYRTVGSGRPSTVVAHGLGESIETTRPFASGLRGRRTFLHFRGHGGSRATAPVDASGAAAAAGDAEHAADPWTYEGLADDLEGVADRVDATRAIGVSLGTGAILALLARRPDAFEAAVLLLPAALDRPRQDAGVARFAAMADLVDAGRVDDLAALLVDEQADLGADPARDDVRAWARRRAEAMTAAGLAPALRAMPGRAPLPHPAHRALARVSARCLVVGAEGDDVHPASVAADLADALPGARLEILPPGGLVWAHRDRLRHLVTDALRA